MRGISWRLGACLILAGCGGGGGGGGGRLELGDDRLVVEPGLRPQLSPDGGLVAYDYLYAPLAGGGPFYALRTVDVVSGVDTCLTCDRVETPRSAGAPAFHPAGDRLAFTLEKAVHAPVSGSAADPGGGLYNDLAIYDLASDAITVVYETGDGLSVPSNGSSGALHPHFSHDGTLLTWADLIGGPAGVGEIFGTFRVGVGDYTETPAPTLTNIRYFEVPDVKLVVVSGFSPDGTRVYVQCNAIDGQYDHEMDVGEIELATGDFRRIVRTSGQVVDETAEAPAYEEHFAPLTRPGSALALHSYLFFSSLEQGVDRGSPGLLDWVATDLWSLDESGQGPERLTSYNVAGSSQSDGSRAVVSKLGTDLDSTRLVYSLWRVGSELSAADDVFEIRVAELIRR